MRAGPGGWAEGPPSQDRGVSRHCKRSLGSESPPPTPPHVENHCSRGLSFQTGCRKENGVFSCVDTDSFCFSNLVTGERRAEVFLLKDRQGQRKGGRHGRPFKRWNQTPGSCSLVETLPTQGMACASLGDRCPGPLLLPGGSRKEPSLAWGLPAAFSAAALVVRCSE